MEVGENYQDVKKREMETDPCKYERIKGGKNELRCKQRVAANGSSEQGNGLFNSMHRSTSREEGLGNSQMWLSINGFGTEV